MIGDVVRESRAANALFSAMVKVASTAGALPVQTSNGVVMLCCAVL